METPITNPEEVIGFEALDNSLLKCKKGVLWKDSPAHFYLNELREVYKLTNQLHNGTYVPREPKGFKIMYPKPRDILSIAFRDRVYQRSLNDVVLYPIMTKTFIHCNCACQVNKGTDFALDKLKQFLHQHFRKHGNKGYVLQIDIHGYYTSMSHDIAKSTFKRYLDDWSYERVQSILDIQYHGDVGFNPGSQMVQIAGISVLSPIDHFIKEKLRIKYYLRYMDDSILIHEDKDYLEKCKIEIEQRLNKMGFTFNPDKTKVYSLEKGIPFLGFVFKLTKTGKLLMLLNKKNLKHHRTMLAKLAKKVKEGIMTLEQFDQGHQSWCAHVKRSPTTHKVLREVDKLYRRLREEIIQDGNREKGTTEITSESTKRKSHSNQIWKRGQEPKCKRV